MKKQSYSVVCGNCSCGDMFQIYESQPTMKQLDQGTVTSQTNPFPCHPIGTLTNPSPETCSLTTRISNMQLLMYGQFLSTSSAYQKSSICGSQEIAVMTQKKVLLGRVRYQGCCCGDGLVDIVNVEDVVVFRVGEEGGRVRGAWGKCLGWICCGTARVYAIYAINEEKVGKIQVFADSCCKSRYQIQFPESADTKSKILLMNSLIFLK